MAKTIFGKNEIYTSIEVFKDIVNGYYLSVIAYKNAKERFPNFRDQYGNNLLHIAIQANQRDIVEYLLDIGVNPIQYNLFRQTPWNYAIALNNKEIIELLCNKNDLIRENKLLKRKNNDLENELDTLKTTNKRLKVSNDTLISTFRKK